MECASEPDPLFLACLHVVVSRIGDVSTDAEILWAGVLSYLFACGEIAESNISVALH